MIVRATIASLLALSVAGFGLPPAMALSQTPPVASVPDPRLFFETNATFYGDNLEYENSYSRGRTYFGAFADLNLLFSRPTFDLSLGVLIQRDFGDEDEVSEALPLFRFRYRSSWYQIIFGHLFSMNNHGLHQALVAREYRYVYPAEEGLQILARYGSLETDLWLNWYLLNTWEHREFFAAGLHSKASWSFVHADLGLRASHHGGQLFDVDDVSENGSAMLRVSLSHSWPALHAPFGAAATLFGSYDNPDRSGPAETVSGGGGEGECFISPYGWKIYYRIFSGKDFRVEQGDPLYRTEKPLHRFGASKIFRLADEVRASLIVEGVVIDSEPDYNYSFVVDVSLDLLLYRFRHEADPYF